MLKNIWEYLKILTIDLIDIKIRTYYMDVLTTKYISEAHSLERVLIYALKPASNIVRYNLTDEERYLLQNLLEEGFIKRLNDIKFKIGYRCLRYVTAKEENKPTSYKQLPYISLKQFRQLGKGSRYIILLPEWVEFDEFVKCEIISENEMKLTKVDIVEKRSDTTNGLLKSTLENIQKRVIIDEYNINIYR